mgnify:CR=1 FL=1
MNTKVTIAGVEWNNPVTVASGTFGSGAEFTDFVDLNRLGAVTTKGVANVPWTGNPTPRVAETYGGMMNAVGLQNPGIDVFCERDIPFLRKYDTKIIVNVCGKTTEDYIDVVEKLSDQLYAMGIKNFWNFSHYDLTLDHKDIVVENVHLSDSLMTLCYRVNEKLK